MGDVETALIAELAKKSWLCWISYGDPPHAHPVWHAWVTDAICVVAGGEEQPLPAIEEQTEVLVTLRTKATRERLATCRARVERVMPDHPDWEAIAQALVTGRLNLRDPSNAPDRWAWDSVVVRLVPTEVVEAPGSQPDDRAAAAPIDSPATTVGKPPPVLHRRKTRRRPLS
ncbi:MAG TPA: hypothetical protein VEX15_02045 [Nocardioidaceae bacterium]|nr:hypothetical protein [Nocardioidaceae bacterium]